MVRRGVLAGVHWCGGVAAVSAAELSSRDARFVVEQSAGKYAETFARQNAKAPAAPFAREVEWVSAGETIFQRLAVIEAESAAAPSAAIN